METGTTNIPFFDWMSHYIGVIVPIFLSLIAGLFFMARQYKDDIHELVADAAAETEKEFVIIRHELKNVRLGESLMTNHIAVLQVEQRNTVSQLTEIKEMAHVTNRKLDSLFEKMSVVLLEIRKDR